MNILDKIMIFGARSLKRYTNFMITDETSFKKILKSHSKLIIVFGHPLCAPCQRLFFQIPYFYLKSKLRGRVLRFCNVNELKNLSKDYEITLTPTLLYFENQQQKIRITDYQIMKQFF